MQRPRYRELGPLLETLRELRRGDAMPITIVAHVATPVAPWGSQRPHRELLAALAGEFADAPLYADISALCSWGKAGYFRRLAQRPVLHHKLLFGSDFPVPPALPRLRGAIRGSTRQLHSTTSWPQQAALAGRLAGYQEIVFQRGAELLPHVDHFANPRVT